MFWPNSKRLSNSVPVGTLVCCPRIFTCSVPDLWLSCCSSTQAKSTKCTNFAADCKTDKCSLALENSSVFFDHDLDLPRESLNKNSCCLNVSKSEMHQRKCCKSYSYEHSVLGYVQRTFIHGHSDTGQIPRSPQYFRTSVRGTKKNDYWSLENRKKHIAYILNKANNDWVLYESLDVCYYCHCFNLSSKGIVCFRNALMNRPYADSRFSSGSRDRVFYGSGSSFPSQSDASDRNRHSVVLLGLDGVGKDSLTSQFLHYNSLVTANGDSDANGFFQENTVSIDLNGEENKLTFETSNRPESWLDDISYSSTSAFVVVYSVNDSESFKTAARVLALLRCLEAKYFEHQASNLHTLKAVVLVGNKVDLVRCRTISNEEGRALANKYEAKFIETSAAINYNIDKLLVGIIKQINPKYSRRNSDASLLKRARGLMCKLVHLCERKVRSHESLSDFVSRNPYFHSHVS